MGFKKHVSELKLYESGKPIELVARDYGLNPRDIIKLASNENPLGASPKAIRAIKKSARDAFRYPDDSFYLLKNALAKKHNVESKNIIIGQGSDQIIELVIQSICARGSKILTSATTFAMYEIYARQFESSVIRTKSGIHDAREFIECIQKHKPDIIFLCTPNNPLGDCMDRSEVYRVLEASGDSIVVLDCAYGEFASFKDSKKALNPREIIQKYPHAIYLGTFSKLYGLGGMRVGFGIAQDLIISTLHKLRAPFNITNLSANAALAALGDKKFVKKTLKNNAREMEVYEKFAKKHGIKTIESYTNFITFLLPKKCESSALCEFLLKKGVIIRDLKSYGLNAVRITIGKKAQNRVVLALISDFLKR